MKSNHMGFCVFLTKFYSNIDINNLSIAKLSQAPAKQGWVGFISSFSNQPTHHPPGKVYCQNPNLTTTQPNLNIGLGLTRLSQL